MSHYRRSYRMKSSFGCREPNRNLLLPDASGLAEFELVEVVAPYQLPSTLWFVLALPYPAPHFWGETWPASHHRYSHLAELGWGYIYWNESSAESLHGHSTRIFLQACGSACSYRCNLWLGNSNIPLGQAAEIELESRTLRPDFVEEYPINTNGGIQLRKMPHWRSVSSSSW